MNKIVHMKDAVLAALAVAGSALARYLGGWDAALAILIGLMLLDYLTGVLVAALWKKSNKSATGTLDSRAGFRGICKKGVILMLVWVGVLLDNAIGAQYVRTAVILFFIGNEGLSLLENVGLMGVPYPKFLKEMLEALRQRGDEGEEKKDGA